jgi:hypothetical protein
MSFYRRRTLRCVDVAAETDDDGDLSLIEMDVEPVASAACAAIETEEEASEDADLVVTDADEDTEDEDTVRREPPLPTSPPKMKKTEEEEEDKPSAPRRKRRKTREIRSPETRAGAAGFRSPPRRPVLAVRPRGRRARLHRRQSAQRQVQGEGLMRRVEDFRKRTKRTETVARHERRAAAALDFARKKQTDPP